MPFDQLVSTLDRVRVLESFSASGTPPDPLACMVAFGSSPKHIDGLLKRIQTARALEPSMIPPDLVTMNSVVRVLDEDTREEETYTLAYPDATPGEEPRRVSIHSVLGSAIFGRRVGEQIDLPTKRGRRRVRITALDYQPESAGDFDR